MDESKLPTPKGPLVWGEVNFVHTTDIHGWLRGHQHVSHTGSNCKAAYIAKPDWNGLC